MCLPEVLGQNAAFDQGLQSLPLFKQFLDTSSGSKVDVFKLSWGVQILSLNKIFPVLPENKV